MAATQVIINLIAMLIRVLIIILIRVVKLCIYKHLDHQVAFSVVLQPTVHFLEDVSAFPMRLTVNSSNPDSTATMEDNTAAFSLPVRVKTDLRIRG